MKCEAICGVCYFSGGRMQEFDENDLLWFCEVCKRIFFCEVGLGHDYNYLGKTSFSCPQCRTPLIKQEVDKIIIAKKMHTSRKMESHEIYHQLMTKKVEKQKLHLFHRNTKPKVSVLLLSQISELNDINGLDNDLILEAGRSYKLELNKLGKIKKKKDLLKEIAQVDEKFLEYLYNAIFNFDESLEAFKLRIAIYFSQMDRNKVKIYFSNEKSNFFDLKIISDSDDEIWIFCTEYDLDVGNLERLANRAFSVDYAKNPQIKAVYIIAKSFSYMALSMIDKYQSALTAVNEAPENESSSFWKTLPIVLWKEVPQKLEFHKVRK